MASSQTPEQRELALVGKVEMRIALADSDDRLSSTLKTYLAPLLLKLASEHPNVRNKVISICQHINTRVKPASIQLPVAALVKQFKEQESQLVRHFDLLYIQQGVGRLSNADQSNLLPIVVKDIAKSGSHGPQIFNLLVRLLESYRLPLRGSKEDTEMRTQMLVSDHDTDFLASALGNLFLFTPQKNANVSCPGLAPEAYAFLTLQGKEDVWNPAAGGLNLLRTKVLAARLLASGLFTDTERFLPALYASSDTASNISDIGDDILKRASSSTDFEDDILIRRLYDLYFGTAGIPRVRAPLRLKILGILNKSTKSTTYPEQIVKMIDDGIDSPTKDGDDVVMSNTNSSTGREVTKLRAAIFAYINFVAKFGTKDTLYVIAPRAITRLRDFIENQGWPKPGPNEDLVSRGYAYEVMGLLAKAGPRSVLIEEHHPTLDLLRWLFSSLSQEAPSIVVSIEESLSAMLLAYSRLQLTPAEQATLENLLIEEMDYSTDQLVNKRSRSTRYVTIRFANRCLPYDSVKARWINVLGLGAGDDRAEVREEAERGLSPYWYRMLNGASGGTNADDLVFPSFAAVMAQFFPPRGSSGFEDHVAVVRRTQQDHSASFYQMVAFARRMLFQEAMREAGVAVAIDSEWERKLDVAVETGADIRKAVKAYMQGLMKTASAQLRVLQYALFESTLSASKDADQRLVEFLALSPDTLTAELVPYAGSLLQALQSNDHAKRLEAARAYGILASHQSVASTVSQDQLSKLYAIAQTWASSVGAASNACHGAIIALGFYFSRSGYRGANLQEIREYSNSLSTVLDVLLQSRDDLLKEASYIFLGQVSLYHALSVEDITKKEKLRVIVDKLYEGAKSGNETAITALGQLTMILPEVTADADNDLDYIGEQLHKLHEIRQAEAHFTVGEALSYLACAWQSSALATELDIDGPEPTHMARSTTLGKLVDRVLKDCENTKPSLKKAAVIWLLCLVQFCGAHSDIQQRLARCQLAFKRCLVDRDELVQETASRGLGLVYEKGDRSLKDGLVRDLVSSFSSDRTSQLAGNVSADTQLFEPGALPTGDGSVSTYKDIMSLAAEVGDSTLVYRFMAMASSNAIWSSRAAFGRFGLSSVLSDSSVDGYLASNPKLYPKLFRYKFDPNSGVRRSMNDIWNALVKDSAATTDTHYDAIMDDLLTNILGKEWRVRQASCAAVADLVSWPLQKYEKYLERIWTQCFKVLDDIKESVRAAAASLARTLTGVLTRALEVDHSSTKNASAMLKHVLPFLLSPSGMESSAKEVQAFSVNTLLEIIKKSNGSTLRPFIPDLVERLIALLSSLEPEAVNYIHLNASKYNLTEQKIDDMRLSSVRTSPLMEAVERCIDLLDDETMHILQPRLENAMKNAVGLPSKVGSSRVLVSLSTRRMALFRPFSDDFLRLIEKLVLDRNETVASSYAVAAGYIARSASDKQILRLIGFAQRLYFDSEGDREASIPRRSISSGEVMYALVKHASDRFNALASSALPFVFVAKHDGLELVKEQFQNTWNDAVGGSRAVLLYLNEILQICNKHLDSPQWTLKHTSARAIADATIAVSAVESTMSANVADQLWPAIEKGLSGKTWDGKEVVLSSFVKFAEKGQAYYAQRPSVQAAMKKIIVREAKRQNVAYRQHAVKALGQTALALDDIDLFEPAYDIVSPLLSDTSEAMEVDGDDSRKSDEIIDNTRAAAIEALFSSINPLILKDDDLNAALSKATHLVVSMGSLRLPAQRTLYDSLAKIFDRIRQAGKGSAITFDITDLSTILSRPNDTTEVSRLKKVAVEAMRSSTPQLQVEASSEG